MIISTDVENAFDKIQHPFMIKKKHFQKMGIEETYLNIIKTLYNKPTARKHSQQWKTESIPSKIRNKTRVLTLTTIIQHRFGSPSYDSQRRKRIKRNLDWKRTSKILTVRRWHDTIHRKPWRYCHKFIRANQWL